MTRFLLGVAVGYLFSDVIDELLGKSKAVVKEGAEAAEEKAEEVKTRAEAAKEAAKDPGTPS